MVGFQPSKTKEVFPEVADATFEGHTPTTQGLSALPPDDTYFVVFRYGAVVLFQGQRKLPELDHTIKHVVAPKHGPYAHGPWETDKQVWEEASGRENGDADRHLIYLLLRPFMSDMSPTLPVRHFCATSHADCPSTSLYLVFLLSE